jgi:diguanylate cyclase
MAETAFLAPPAPWAVPAARLASAWLAALAVTGDEVGDPETPLMDAASAQSFLATQSTALLGVLLGDPFQPRQAAAVGDALVRANFVRGDVLGRSLRVLLLRLPELICAPCAGIDGMERRVAEMTEALANGYVRALRDRTLAEQESIRLAELDAQQIISEKLRHQATHDPLTGLPNRAAVLGRMTTALASRRGNWVGVCYLDLDGFKGINDRYGHEAGDELLVTVARRIGETAAGHGAVAGRLGGDEFLVLVESSAGLVALVALATAILTEVRRPIALRIGRVGISACAGIAECAAGSPTAHSLVADADSALYLAKSRGAGGWAVSRPMRRQASLTECPPTIPGIAPKHARAT